MNKQLEKGEFISGNKWTTINEIMRPSDGQIFKIGDMVDWCDPDDWLLNDDEREYYKDTSYPYFTGTISKIMIIEDSKPQIYKYNIEICLRNTEPHDIGRLDLNDIEVHNN